MTKPLSMKINRSPRWFTALLILFGVINLWSQKNVASLPLLMDSHHMSSTKKRLAEGDPDLKTAYEVLLTAADAMLEEGPFAVTEKTNTLPAETRMIMPVIAAIGGPIQPKRRTAPTFAVMEKPTHRVKALMLQTGKELVLWERIPRPWGWPIILAEKRNMQKKRPNYFEFGFSIQKRG